MRSITDEDLVLMHYRELDAATAAAVEAELARDPALAARYRALSRTLAAAGDAPVPEPDAGLGARIWARVEPELAARGPGAARRGPGAAGWFALAASAAFAAVLLLRAPREAVVDAPAVAAAPVAISAEGRERLLLTRVAHHLDGSQRLLASVSNAEPRQPELEATRAWAERALGANRIYRSAADAAGEKRVVALLDAMEPLLIEIANAPEGLSADELAFLQQRIAEADLLFRLRSAQRRIETRANQAVAPGVQPDKRSDI